MPANHAGATTGPDYVEYIDRFAAVARPIIRTYFRVDSCIASTAIAIAVFKHLGIKAEPFSCSVMIFNRAFITKAEREGWPQGSEEVHKFTSDGVSWSVGVGYQKDGSEPVGHLVALVGEDHLLVDASIDQGNRPAKNIFLPPVLAVPTTREFRRGGAKLVLCSDGPLIYYQPTKLTRYLTSPDWTQPERHHAAIIRILAAMEAPIEAITNAIGTAIRPPEGSAKE